MFSQYHLGMHSTGYSCNAGAMEISHFSRRPRRHQILCKLLNSVLDRIQFFLYNRKPSHFGSHNQRGPSVCEDHQVPTVTTVLAKSLLAIRMLVPRVRTETSGQSNRVSQIHDYIFSYGMGGYKHSVLTDMPSHEQPPAWLQSSLNRCAQAQNIPGDGLQTHTEVISGCSSRSPSAMVSLTPLSSLWSRDCFPYITCTRFEASACYWHGGGLEPRRLELTSIRCD